MKVLQEDDQVDEEITELLIMNYSVSDGIQVPLQIEGKDCTTQQDTEASRTVVPISFFDKYCKGVKLEDTKITLKTYTHESDNIQTTNRG